MKNLLTIGLCILFSSCILAQDNWTEYYQSEDLKVTYRYADCHDSANGIHQQKVLLRFENKTNSTIKVDFSRVSDYGIKSNNNEAACSLQLPPMSITQGDCLQKNKCLFFFSKHLNMDGRKLNGFELTNIKISKEQ